MSDASLSSEQALRERYDSCGSEGGNREGREAQGIDPKLFLKLLETTDSRASASRIEEFMKRNNSHGRALSNSDKDLHQALAVAANLKIPLPLTSMAHQIQEMGRAQGWVGTIALRRWVSCMKS